MKVSSNKPTGILRCNNSLRLCDTAKYMRMMSPGYKNPIGPFVNTARAAPI